MKNQTWRNSPSTNRPFKSRYGAGYVTPENYLAEGMCARRARKEKVDLPERFWQLDKWKRIFLLQVRFASGLLRVYDIQAIVAVLKRNPLVFSLNAKWLDPFFKDEQAKLNLIKKKQEENPPPVVQKEEEIPFSPQKPFNNSKPLTRKLDEYV